MTWKETPNNKSLQEYIEERLKKIYPYEIDKEDNRIYFSLPDESVVRVDNFKKNEVLVMSYWSDIDEDMRGDGDLYYLEDYDTLDEMFEAMLEETRR